MKTKIKKENYINELKKIQSGLNDYFLELNCAAIDIGDMVDILCKEITYPYPWKEQVLCRLLTIKKLLEEA